MTLFYGDNRGASRHSTFKSLAVILLRVKDFQNKSQIYLWFQYGISLTEHNLVGPFQFGTSGSKNSETK